MEIKYLQMFNELKVKPEWKQKLKETAYGCVVDKAKYMHVQEKTKVPWYVIAAIHELESGRDFTGVLHNGERIVGTDYRTRLVPAGRGPFKTWEESAIDALMMKERIFPDWNKIGAVLDFCERYNGLGYRKRNVPSPYLWSGSQYYSKGKYVADGKYDPNAVSKQLGAALLIKELTLEV